ncbi:MAG: AAA family ATPase [Burkholderiales bacterium]
MYYEHFGLNQAPFKITPNTDFFFSGGNRGPILEALIYAVTHGEGIIKVSGEVGSGKTMLCNMLMQRLPENVETVYLANPSVSPEEILHAIAFELHLNIERAATRLEVMQKVQAHLLTRHADGKRVVIFVEESQGMPLATLEEMRLLSNLETKNDKLLQIVLFGQPELDENLRQPNIRQLRERITHSFGLVPLQADEVREYLMFRLRAAGYHGPDLFADNVVKLIARASSGLTRRINLIADKALLAAFSENTHTIKTRHVEAALKDSEFSQTAAPAGVGGRGWWIAAAVAVGIAIGMASYRWLSPPADTKPVPASTPPSVSAAKPPVAAVESSPPDLSPPAAQTGTDILQARLTATTDWMARQRDDTWTVQLLTTASQDDLRNYLNGMGKTIEINEVFVYRSHTDQKGLLSVLYGTHDSKASAERALASLPGQFKVNRPVLRTVQSIRAELKRP